MDKSYVTMEQQVCMVCGHPFDTGAILMDTRLRERFDRLTVTGFGLCPEDQKGFDEGYLALVEVKNNPPAGSRVKPSDADRTGQVCHIRRIVADRIFNVKFDAKQPVAFVQVGVIAKLQAMTGEHDDPSKTTPPTDES